MLAANWSQRWELDVRFRTRWSTLKRASHGSLLDGPEVLSIADIPEPPKGITHAHIQWMNHTYTHPVKRSSVHISSECIICTHNHWRNNILSMGGVARSVSDSLSFTSHFQTNFLIPMLLDRIEPGLSGWKNTSCHGWEDEPRPVFVVYSCCNNDPTCGYWCAFILNYHMIYWCCNNDPTCDS